MLEELRRMFVGHKVSVTHSGDYSVSMKDQFAVCVAVHRNGGKDENSFDVELSNQDRIGIIVETKTPTSVEGNMGQVRGRRKIEIVP